MKNYSADPNAIHTFFEINDKNAPDKALISEKCHYGDVNQDRNEEPRDMCPWP